MHASRRLLLARWLLAALLMVLHLAPAGLVGWRFMPFCGCGMARGHCSCGMSHGKAGGHAPCGMNGMMPDHCSLRSSQPMESRTAPLGPDFHDRPGVFRPRVPEIVPEPRGVLSSRDVLPPAARSAPPELRPPRISIRIG